jgi:Domain of unknown function (DUF4381)
VKAVIPKGNLSGAPGLGAWGWRVAASSTSSRKVLVPEGHSENSPTFRTLGTSAANSISPEGTAEAGAEHRLLNRPFGTFPPSGATSQRSKRWAIFERPSGTASGAFRLFSQTRMRDRILPRVFSLARRALVTAFLFGPLSLLGAQGPGLLGENLLPGKPRGEIPPGFWEQNGFWVLLIGAVALAAAGIVAWYLTRPKPAIVVSPEAEARRRLKELHERPEDGTVLSTISQILRRYLAAAFSLPPDEMTTAEFCRAIENQERIGPDLSGAIGRLLRQWDKRKFAPAPTGPALDATVEALALIDLAEARLARLREAAEKHAAMAQAAPAGPALAKEAR